MNDIDKSFLPDSGLEHAVYLLRQSLEIQELLPDGFPNVGFGEADTLDLLAPHVLGRAARLDKNNVLAHMDPPTPWITWATSLWNARLNQNLLHPATAPFAIEAEHKVMDWLTPFFGMNGGHMCSASTIANLTALWAARDAKGVKKVVASKAAHISIEKAARILGLPYEQIPTNSKGKIELGDIGDVSEACLVLTAGTTSTGAIDAFTLADPAKWIHVDAAWAGPLRLSHTHAHLLDGIDIADSIAVSAHKWFFQPKDSALIMFKEPDMANQAISFGSSYLAASNIGIQGSRGAAAIPLLATMIAWGKTGFASRIDRTMTMASELAKALDEDSRIVLWAMPETGVNVFRPLTEKTEEFYTSLPEGMFSTCMIDNDKWIRSVAANPLANIDDITSAIREALH